MRDFPMTQASTPVSSALEAALEPVPTMTLQEFCERVKAVLRTQPAGTGLKDGDSGGEYFMDGEGLFICSLSEPRSVGPVEVDPDPWDSARGCWEGTTPEQTIAIVDSPEFLPARIDRPKTLVEELTSELDRMVEMYEKLLVESRITNRDAAAMRNSLHLYTGAARALVSKARQESNNG